MPDRAAHASSAGDAENALIAMRLGEYADLLEAQGEDGFRVKAYRNAARTAETLSEPLRRLFEEGGAEALIPLKGIGRGIASAIGEMLTSGRWRQLDRLKGEVTPETLFRTLPGIGKGLAHNIVDALDIETLEDLETALRLGDTPVPGIGPRRRAAILAALEQRLASLRRGRPTGIRTAEPSVSLLLDADRLYREKAAAGELRRIAPKRFNPTGEAWLPIMHARRGDWHLTVLYSNTARAHELGRTREWVIIYFHEDDGPEGRRTVVTERHGKLSGKRVVRGREDACLDHYAKEESGSPILESPD